MFDVVEYKQVLSNSTSINDCKKVPIPNIESNQNYIFISYSHLDYKEVYADLAEMYVRGVRFWYDNGLRAGKEWDEEIKSKIENGNCVGVIFYMSENLFRSISANKEIQITYDLSSKEQNNIKKNYFGINLTSKTSAEILATAMSSTNELLTMEHIRTLSAAFSDKATYLKYDSPDHITELIYQIETQFEVVDKNDEFELHLELDTSACDTIITSLDGHLRMHDVEKANELASFLTNIGHKVYISNYDGCSIGKFNKFIYKQDEYKLKQCKNIICITATLLAVALYKDIQTMLTDLGKNIIFYLDDGEFIKGYPELEKISVCKNNYKSLLPGLLCIE